MKKEDFERLKAVCEKEGFEITGMDSPDIWHITKKDPWDGVEFVLDTFNGNILRVDSLKLKPSPMVFKASTEQAYIAQLEKEAFERFGEIREGDRFDRYFKNYNGEGTAVSGHSTIYFREGDEFHVGGICIYQSGKWATRVKERVRVDPKSADSIRKALHKGFDTDYNEFREFLASQLEEYLNK